MESLLHLVVGPGQRFLNPRCKIIVLSQPYLGDYVLRPERPFTGASGPSWPEIAESFWGFAKKSLKMPEKEKKS